MRAVKVKRVLEKLKLKKKKDTLRQAQGERGDTLRQAQGERVRPARSKIERLVSIPDDVVLAPQAEAPRHNTGIDRSGPHSRIRELTWASFDRMVQGMAKEVSSRFKPEAVIGVAHGGVFVGGAIASALQCEFFPVRISRRSRDQGKAAPKLYGQMPKELKGRRVLIVDDVAASGDTLELASTLAGKAGAKAVKTATLVSRTDGYAPDWCALPTDEFVVFPWDYQPVAEDGRFG